jgi:hypothetical protein
MNSSESINEGRCMENVHRTSTSSINQTSRGMTDVTNEVNVEKQDKNDQ